MEKAGVLPFEVGQLAEMKSYEIGYRGAWFRCKIKDIILKSNKIKLEYYDFPEEELSWEKIYQVPPYGRKSKHIKKQLMLRPQYPRMFHISEMPPVNSISEVCVVIDGTFKVGDLVDWFKDDCYWSARVIKVLSDDQVEIELPMPPAGERKEDEEEGPHEPFCKDLRPYLDWSQSKGWTVPTMEGQTSSSAQLIFPSKQDALVMDLEVENVAAASPLNASSTTHISAEEDTKQQSSDPVDTVICEESVQNEDVKMEDEFVESSDSISSLRVEHSKAAAGEGEGDINNNRTDLNIMREDTLEAAILDLEELCSKIRWMKNLLQNGQSPSNDAPSWKFT